MTPLPDADPAVLEEGAAHLEEELAFLDARVEAAIVDWSARLESGVSEPLARAVSGAREAHALLIDEAGFPEASVPTVLPPHRLRTYREGVLERVLTPLRDAIRSVSPTSRTGAEWDALLAAIGDAAGVLPAEVTRAEPSDLFLDRPGDGVGRRLRKGAVRAGRALAAPFGRSRHRAQRVPLRALGTEILRGDAIPGAQEALESIHLHHARGLALVERGVAAWVRDWFPLEDDGRAEGSPLPPEVASRLADLRSSLETVLRKEEDGDAASGGGGAEDGHREADAPGDGSAGGEGEGPAEVSAGTKSPSSVAFDLQTALGAAVDLLSDVPAFDQRIRDGVARLRRHLSDAVLHAGTAMGFVRSGADRKRLARLGARRERRTALWVRWEATALNRLHLAIQAGGFRGNLDGALDELFVDSSRHFLEYLTTTLREARRAIHDLGAQAADRTSVLLTATDPGVVAAEIEALLASAHQILQTEVTELLDPDSTRPPLTAVADRAAERLADRARELPGALDVHPLREPSQHVDPEEGVRRVDLREIVQQSLDVLRLEAFRSAVTPLLTALENVARACEETPEVVSYNLSAAREELVSEAAGDPAQALDDARNLTLQGLERAADQLELTLAHVLEPWDAFAERAHTVLLEAARLTHERLVIDKAVQEQLRDFHTLVAGWARQLRQQASALWVEVRRLGKRLGRRVWIQGLRAVRFGRAAVGAEPVAEGEKERAHDVFRDIPALVEGLPLVYRRLFSFRPVTEPALLVGRSAEMEWVAARYAAWRDGFRSPSMLVGPATVGITSLLNVLEAQAFPGARAIRLSLTGRCRLEADLASRITDALHEAGVLEGAAPPETLRELAGLLLERPRPDADPPVVILVDHFAHLILRVPGGMDLAERFLEFQARTSPSVFWLSTTSEPTWQLLRKTGSRAAALPNVIRMPPLGRDAIEELIMVRHRRSGVPVEFTVPRDASPILRRRMKRAHAEDERQEILQTEYFDRLHRATQGNVIMAILLWLKSADFESRRGWLRVNPPRAVLASLAEELELEMAFGLKALLEHASLTLEDYAAVFAVDAEEAYRAMEALRTRMLLARMDMQGELPRPVRRVEPGVEYRVPPILTEVVSSRLRKHHVLH